MKKILLFFISFLILIAISIINFVSFKFLIAKKSLTLDIRISNNLNYISNTQESDELKDSKDIFDDFCEKFGEWEPLNQTYFFKRSACFYFIDKGIFRFSLVKSSYALPSKFLFHIMVKLDGEKMVINQKILSTKLETRLKLREYELVYIDAKFDFINKIINVSKYLNASAFNNFDHDALAKNISIQIQIEVEH